MNILIRDINLQSTNANWEVDDLQSVHKVNKKGEVLLYKQLEVDKASVWLDILSSAKESGRDITAQEHVRSPPVANIEMTATI